MLLKDGLQGLWKCGCGSPHQGRATDRVSRSLSRSAFPRNGKLPRFRCQAVACHDTMWQATDSTCTCGHCSDAGSTCMGTSLASLNGTKRYLLQHVVCPMQAGHCLHGTCNMQHVSGRPLPVLLGSATTECFSLILVLPLAGILAVHVTRHGRCLRSLLGC